MPGMPRNNISLPSAQPCKNSPIWSVYLPNHPENLGDIMFLKNFVRRWVGALPGGGVRN